MRSEEQLARLLRMVPYLSAHQGVTTEAVAEAFGTTPRQVIRDLEILQFCGLPGGYYDDLFDVDIEGVRDHGHIYFRNADVLARPLRLRPAEAASLVAALHLVVELAGESAAASSALAKLTSAIGDAGTQLAVTVAASDPSHRAALVAAREAGRVVRLTYRTPGRPGISTAEVEPVRLRLVDGFTYLDAWSLTRGAWRSYRLDRIELVEPLETPSQHRGEPPSTWFEDAALRLTITVTRDAAWIVEYYPTTAVEDLGSNLRVTFPVASMSWAAALVLRLGDSVVEVSDDAVVGAAREQAAAALALYADSAEVG